MKIIAEKKSRIVHVAPYFEKGNPFGGPLSVAINVVHQLGLEGCNPILIAGNRTRERKIDGVQSELFHSFRIYNNKKITGLFSPQLIVWLIRNRETISIMHIHLARELNTALSAIVAKKFEIPYIIQTHGMIRKPKTKIESLFDRFFTRRIIRHSRAVLYLTSDEKKRLEKVESRANYIMYSNSVKIEMPRIDFRLKNSEVIYVSRLHSEKQPLVFLEIALQIAVKYPNTQFTVIGPDGGELAKILSRLKSCNVRNVNYEGVLSPNLVKKRLARSTIFVLPTLADVFPLALLEAMVSGCAIVTTDACEISNLIKDNELGIVSDTTKQQIQDAIEWLLMNPIKCQTMGKSAEQYAILNFDIKVSARTLINEIYGNRSPDSNV